ncbi:ABC transporter substrate-binding protein [Breznakiella homolactica]|uniref:ABC transporter substrate-binding protein n=1 Tax=Breznakiella homolactica TaxID=2798577 RepID=A0A7T8B827_9SPIR|nr:ABC transporter substrate-binding protein [Breznakiella homolactica]QQO08134.1 ABC transporter substrate-binding protein [Breznakiella homolactica]
MKKRFVSAAVLVLACMLLAVPVMAGGQNDKGSATGDGPIVLRFYFPVGVAGPLATYMGEMAAEFTKAHPNIIVEPIYSGGYIETIQRALTSSKAGNPPDVALLTAADIWTGVDEKIILPLGPFIKQEGGDAFLSRYFEAFLDDCDVAGEYYALPFQKSTPIFYYNKDMFREAGLDPNKPPATWTEMKDMAQKLVQKERGETTRWGVEIPIDQWLLSCFIFQNGGQINNPEGTKTFLNSSEAIGALEFLQSLSAEGLMPARRLFGDSSADFVAGKTAMMYNSTGSMAFVKESATFDWGVAFLPENKKRIVATGGGQLVIMSGIPEARQKAAWEFLKWMTEPEQAAYWSMKTGYVAVNKGAFDVPEMKQYVEGFPYSIAARDQLQYAVGEPPSTHNARQISRFMTDAIEGALAGRVTPAAALNSAQAEAEKVLQAYNK